MQTFSSTLLIIKSDFPISYSWNTDNQIWFSNFLFMEYKLIKLELLNIYKAQKVLSTIFHVMKRVFVRANMQVSLPNKHYTFNP